MDNSDYTNNFLLSRLDHLSDAQSAVITATKSIAGSIIEISESQQDVMQAMTKRLLLLSKQIEELQGTKCAKKKSTCKTTELSYLEKSIDHDMKEIRACAKLDNSNHGSSNAKRIIEICESYVSQNNKQTNG
tara:strand:+ start:538 stop:933 length:396 start_codon:yes stop_codon:yes gene_type:complete